MPDTTPVNRPDLLDGLDQIISPGHTAVLVIDVQNDFCAENGYIHVTQNADMGGNKLLAARIGRLVQAAREAGTMVVWVKAVYDHDLLTAPMLSKILEKGDGAVCCASDSWGADFFEISPAEDEFVIEKHCYSAFHGTGLDDILRRRGIRSLVVCGVATNVCVDSTLRAGFFHGYYIVMPPDCVGSANQTLHEATIRSVDFIFGSVPSSEEIAGVWTGRTAESAAE